MILRALATLGLLWVLGFVLFVVLLPEPAADVVTDGVVVPTGGPGRIARGLEVLERRQARRMLVTGVDRRVRPHELALAQGVSRRLIECCVDLGREAVDTRSNGEETADWVERRGIRSVRLVTTDWHMRRARLELRHALGEEVRIVPDAVASDAPLVTLLREYNKYLLRGAALGVGL